MSPSPLKLVPPSPLKGPADTRPPSPSRPRHQTLDDRGIARRRLAVTVAKRALPVVALVLLSLVALWPQFDRNGAAARLAFRGGLGEPENGALTQPHYNGVDDHDRPYTVTATTARQSTQDRIDMTSPVGDMSLANGSWLRAESQKGVYVSTSGQLDLAGNVVLYRDDGVTLQTDTANLDVKSGAASSADRVHVEGPFGTLDAQGFVVLDRGNVVQFAGPARLLLNGTSHAASPIGPAK